MENKENIEIYKVLHYPHALLKKKSTPVEKFTVQLKNFVKNLIETAYKFEGGGIAAPQVGVCKRIFVSDFTHAFDPKSGFERTENDFIVMDSKGNKVPYKFPMVFINPEIIEQSEAITTNWEGCLSFPNADSHIINRYQSITVKAQNEHGETFSVKTHHLYASVNFQHEIDHLNGLTMIDHWNKNDFSEKTILNEIKDYENDPSERKRIKKLKLVEANKINFDFL